jgi:hypothetical protein
MPNPNDPEQAECRRCYDTGHPPGSDRLCQCVSGGEPSAPPLLQEVWYR